MSSGTQPGSSEDPGACTLLTARENIVTILVIFVYNICEVIQCRIGNIFFALLSNIAHILDKGANICFSEKQRTIFKCLSPGSASSPLPPWIQGTRTQHRDPHGLHRGRQPPGLVVVQMSFLMKATMIFMLVLAPEKCVLYGAGDYDAY